MRNIVRAYIEKQQLLAGDAPVLVGFSGGADSVALLSLLVQLDYTCIALHLSAMKNLPEKQPVTWASLSIR